MNIDIPKKELEDRGVVYSGGNLREFRRMRVEKVYARYVPSALASSEDAYCRSEDPKTISGEDEINARRLRLVLFYDLTDRPKRGQKNPMPVVYEHVSQCHVFKGVREWCAARRRVFEEMVVGMRQFMSDQLDFDNETDRRLWWSLNKTLVDINCYLAHYNFRPEARRKRQAEHRRSRDDRSVTLPLRILLGEYPEKIPLTLENTDDTSLYLVYDTDGTLTLCHRTKDGRNSHAVCARMTWTQEEDFLSMLVGDMTVKKFFTRMLNVMEVHEYDGAPCRQSCLFPYADEHIVPKDTRLQLDQKVIVAALQLLHKTKPDSAKETVNG